MTFEEMGNMDGKTLMLLPGTCCNWQTNFRRVIPALSEKYHLIFVNYDGFDGSDLIFPDMLTVTKKIELERLKPRLEEWERQGMTLRRFLGWVILILFCAAYIGLFIIGGIDGLHQGFSFRQYFFRFLIIGSVIKAFDIGALDYFLLTKTHFFQHHFPETEGCAGWQDFGYNRKQQAGQSVMILFGSALTAWIFNRIG